MNDTIISKYINKLKYLLLTIFVYMLSVFNLYVQIIFKLFSPFINECNTGLLIDYRKSIYGQEELKFAATFTLRLDVH